MTDSPDKRKRSLFNLIFYPEAWMVKSGWTAIFLVILVVLMSGLEAIYVQLTTTHRVITSETWRDFSFLILSGLDILMPLTIALLSKRALMVYLIAQCFLSSILLHYTIFFYNTLTLSTIYHSLQGAASLGIDIFGFARWDIIFVLGLVLAIKLFLVQVSMGRRPAMPGFFKLRGITAVACMTIITWLAAVVYGKTGLSLLWVETKGHRSAAERRLEEGTKESVRSIGYVGTWLGEFFSGNYMDTTLIYAENRCSGSSCEVDTELQKRWQRLPVPPLGDIVAMVQVESLDYAVLDMRVNGIPVTPFLNFLARRSLVLKTFAPHKVGSCNSDYEILNARVAEQNVVYYVYINDYPDSVIHLLNDRGYRPTVFHGLPGRLFNLRNAYAAQGFVEFHFKNDLLADGYKPGPYIMDHIMDADVFGRAGRQLREATAPLAQFIITMSSHVPFLPASSDFKSVGGTFARYVTALNYVDRCLQEYYNKLPDGAVLVIWGDHGSDVAYPRGFGPGERYVPFLVHVKNDVGWLEKILAERRRNWPDYLPGLEPDLRADRRNHTLGELSYYLRCLFQAAGK